MKIIIASIKEHPALFTQLMSLDKGGSSFDFVDGSSDFENHLEADAFIDLSFKGDFHSPSSKPLLIGETIQTFNQLNYPGEYLGRFCAWQGFTERNCWEIATPQHNVEWINVLMKAVCKEWKLVADEPGLVAPRILSAIINEAFFAWDEGVSNTSQVDQAMMLGTNYPNGPFAWGKKIGYGNIYRLLKQLGTTDSSYTPHPLLLNNIL